MTTKPINEALFAEMWNAGEPHATIGIAVGMARSSVPARAKLMGLLPRVTRPKTPGMLTYGREIDQEKFKRLWNNGTTMPVMKTTFGVGEAAIRARVDLWGLERRKVGGLRRAFVPVPVAKPKPEPKAAPVYHPGLSAAIKRAVEKGREKGDTAFRLNCVATANRLTYREVMEMAGVQG